MSFKDCILANAKNGLIAEKDAKELLGEYARRATELGENGAINEIEAKLLDRMMRQKRNVLLHKGMREKFLERLESFETIGEKTEFVSHTLQAARDKGMVTYKGFMSVLNEGADQMPIGDLNANEFKAAVVAVIDDSKPADVKVAGMASAIKRVFQYAKSEANNFGLIFGDLGETYFPRFYDAATFRKFSDNEFVDIARKYLKFDSNVPDEQVRSVILNFKKNVETDGVHSLLAKSEAISDTDMVRADSKSKPRSGFASRRDKVRSLEFKSGESYVEFLKALGHSEQILVEHFQKYLTSMSTDLGIVKQMGPMPKALFSEVHSKLEAAHVVNKSKKGVKAKAAQVKNGASLRSTKSEFEVLMSNAFTGDRDNPIFKAFTASQNWMRACQLGSATVSALSDPSMGVIASKLNGGSFLQSIKDYMSLIKGVIGSEAEVKQLADELGYVVEGFNGMMIGDTRFTLGGEGKGLAKKIADFTFKASGLDNWTKNGRAIAMVNANNTVASMLESQTAWGSLPDIFRSNLERTGMNEADWALAIKHLPVDEFRGGRKFVQTNKLRVNQELNFGRGAEIADKIDGFVEHMKNISINENNLKTDALTSGAMFSGSGQVGGLGKMGAGALFQYKAYGITVLNNHFIPALRRAVTHRKLDHLAMLMIGTTVMSAIPLQIKEIIKGKNPRDMSDPKFWAAANLQGGGFGILGDFLFKDASRAGNTFAETLAGPYVGAISDVHKFAAGIVTDAVDEEDKRANRGREAMRLIKRNTPLNNLWYTRLVTDRLIFDNLERLLDPKFDRRQKKLEQKLTKENKGVPPYWWRPGDAPTMPTQKARRTARN